MLEYTFSCLIMINEILYVVSLYIVVLFDETAKTPSNMGFLNQTAITIKLTAKIDCGFASKISYGL